MIVEEIGEAPQWVTAEEAALITRREIGEDNLALAQEIVAIEAGIDAGQDVTGDASPISTANVRKLQRAVAFQAAWLETHPDAIDAMDVTGVSQDGLSATYSAQNAAYLAPIAARLIRRLSWRLAPLRARPGGARILDVGNRDNAERDDQFTWSPMGRNGRMGGQSNPLDQRSGIVMG